MGKNHYFNLEAEAAVIGGLLLSNDIFDDIIDILRPEYFYAYEFQESYKLIYNIILKNQKAETLTVSHLAALNNDLKDIITQSFLEQIIDSFPGFASIKASAEIIKDHYIRRKIIDIAQNISTKLNSFENATEAIKDIEANIFQLSENFFIGNKIKSFEDSLSIALDIAQKAKQHNGISGLATHFKDIDDHLGGLQKSDLIILAGRPGMGKTALATNIAYNIASSKEHNNAVLLFSLEMPAEQLASRILAQETGIESEVLRKGIFNDSQSNQLIQAVSQLKSTSLFTDDSSMLTVSELRSKARRFKRSHNLSLIIVDYLQLMNSNKKNENRLNELSEITRGLKSIAKELEVPIIALSQLSRAVESRDDKKPVLSDLRESGTIEQDADIVAFIYREDYYLKGKEPTIAPNEEKTKNEAWQKWFEKFQKVENLATLIIAKNRHGSTKNIGLRFNSKYTKFENLQKIQYNYD